MRRQLGRVWALGGIDDVEAFCLRALERGLRRQGAFLTGEDQQDALAELIARCWELQEREYDPARGVPFVSYAAWKCELEAVEFLRRRFGRNGHRQRLEEAASSLDELVDSGGGDQLRSALTASTGDAALDCTLSRGGLLPGRDRPDLREAVDDVLTIARTPKGVARLLAELRAELSALAEQAA